MMRPVLLTNPYKSFVYVDPCNNQFCNVLIITIVYMRPHLQDIWYEEAWINNAQKEIIDIFAELSFSSGYRGFQLIKVIQ